MVDPTSPAVVALEQERAGRQIDNPDALQAGFEGAFPASDPVSSTITSIPPGSVTPFSAEPGTTAEAPLVDIALASVQEHRGVTSSVSPDEELAALRAEVNRLAENAAEIGSASVRVLRAKSEDVLEDARTRIREQPLRALALALVAGFLFGAVR
jgi:ElaB/YqjD/DUF883 family membrane-anchored ribosome-binding protein